MLKGEKLKRIIEDLIKTFIGISLSYFALRQTEGKGFWVLLIACGHRERCPGGVRDGSSFFVFRLSQKFKEGI